MLGALRIIDDSIAAVEKVVVILLTAMMTLILMSQVILRYGFSRPLCWAEEVSVQLLVFITLIGFSLLIKQRRMILIDMIVSMLPKGAQTAIAIFLQLLGLFIMLVFAYEATSWIMKPEVRITLSPTTQLPVWYNYSVFPAAFYAMSFHQFTGLFSLPQHSAKD